MNMSEYAEAIVEGFQEGLENPNSELIDSITTKLRTLGGVCVIVLSTSGDSDYLNDILRNAMKKEDLTVISESLSETIVKISSDLEGSVDALREFMDRVEDIIFDHGTPPQAYKPTRHHKRKEPTYAIHRAFITTRKHLPYMGRS